jgi:hypothetical protein
MDEARELLGQAIDSVDNLVYSLNLPLPPQLHVESLRKLLPKEVKKLKQGFVAVTGENPWEGQDA